MASAVVSAANDSVGILTDNGSKTVIRNVDVEFPFQPYDCQVAFMDGVLRCLQSKENGVLESPTGTGKTLSLLCASLAWKLQVKAKAQLDQRLVALQEGGDFVESSLRRDQFSGVGDWGGAFASSGAAFFGSGPQIIYASRTHSQLSQAMAELKRSPYGRLFRACILGAREQFCIHDEVQRTENHSAKVHLCRAKVKANICPFYNKLQNKDLNEVDERLTNENHDVEDLVALGKKNKVCPYYVSRSLRAPADIIFTPYNYLLDPKARKSYGIELSQNVVIFDEAHNLEQFCEETSSFGISSYDISTAIEAIDELLQKLQNQDKDLNSSQGGFGGLDFGGGGDGGLEGPAFTVDDLQQLRVVVKLLEENLDALPLGSGGSLSKPGAFLAEFFAGAKVDRENAGAFLSLLENVLQYLNQSRTGSASPWSTKTFGLEKLMDLMNCVFGREAAPAAGGSALHWTAYYRVHVSKEESWQSKKQKKSGASDPWAAAASTKTQRVLNYWCFSPGHCMREVMSQDVHSLILTSGTLAPLSSFTSEMQLPFKVTLENPHIIRPNQFWVGTLPKGPDGTSLSSSYANRFNETYQLSLGNALVNLARIVPDGMLVFFPSYGVMAQLTSKWEEAGISARISQYKPIFKEPKTKAEFQSVMSEYYANINDPRGKGAVFMAVCRGKVSEGLDFADANGRAVVITGLPYPPRMDPRVVLKMEFLSSMRNKLEIQGLGGEEWYKQQAFRAVNQAIGRVIRHKSDWGAIILCDQRFGSSNAKSQLPLWVRPSAVDHGSFGNGLKSLVGFFKEAKIAFPKPLVKNLGKIEDENANYGAGDASSARKTDAAADAFFYRRRAASIKSNSVEYHAPSMDTKRHLTEDDFISTLPSQSPQLQSRKRTLKIEYEEDDAVFPSAPKKLSLASAFDAMDAAPTPEELRRRLVSDGAVKSEEEAALERRMANQTKKRIKVSAGGGGAKESLINQVLKKSMGVAKPLKTSTPKRAESPDATVQSSSINLDGVSAVKSQSLSVEPEGSSTPAGQSSTRVPAGPSLPHQSPAPDSSVVKGQPSVQSKEKAAAYLGLVKKSLVNDASLYKRFTYALKRYQKENDYAQLTKALVEVFLIKAEWHPLLRGFFHFLRPNHKTEFNQLCLNLTGKSC